MGVNKEAYHQIIKELNAQHIQLVAVSKTKPPEEITQLYELGQRDFGENYVQELADKQAALAQDIRWHFIGHLQSNKVKYIAAFVHLIHGVDSLKLLKEINKQAAKNNRIINVLLQIHIAQEETKFGLDEAEAAELFGNDELVKLQNIKITGLMGMASFTNDMQKVKNEFLLLKKFFDKYSSISAANCRLTVLSMGMSNDYKIAVEAGSNMVRIGSLLFGERVYL